MSFDRRLAAVSAALEATRVAGHGLPPVSSMRALVEILRDIEVLLFPGGFEHAEPDGRPQAPSLAARCARIVETLGAELARAFRHATANGGTVLGDPRAEGERVALALLEALPTMRALLFEDARAAFDGDPAARSLVEVILRYPCVRALAVHRVAHFLHAHRVPLVPRMLSEYVHRRTGIDIHPGARIGPGLLIDHGTGVVIGETAVIGRHCKLYQGVTLGALSVEKHGPATWDPPKRHPTLGEHVTVYAHATILGGDTLIGEGSVIGGNVWLTRSVPPQTKVQIDPPNLLYRSAESGPVKEPLDYQI